jgi:hypothetical protein
MITRSFLLFGALALFTLAACGDGSKPAEGTSASAPSGKATAPAAGKPVLEQVKNDAMGYTIKLPKGATTAMSDANGGSYGSDTMVILVGPTGVELKTPDDLLRAVNTDGGTIDKKTVGDAVIAVVTKPSSPVNVYAGPKGKKIAATCMAEPSQKDLAIEICSSLVATK